MMSYVAYCLAAGGVTYLIVRLTKCQEWVALTGIALGTVIALSLHYLIGW